MQQNRVKSMTCVGEAKKQRFLSCLLRRSPWCAAVAVSIEHVFGDAPLFTLCLPVALMRHDRSHRKLMNKTVGTKSTRGGYRVMGRPEDTREHWGLEIAMHMLP